MYLFCLLLNFLCFGVVIAPWQPCDVICFLSIYLLKLIVTGPVYFQASLDSVSWLVLSEMEILPKLCFHHNQTELTNAGDMPFQSRQFPEARLVRLEKEKTADTVKAEKANLPVSASISEAQWDISCQADLCPVQGTCGRCWERHPSPYNSNLPESQRCPWVTGTQPFCRMMLDPFWLKRTCILAW